MSIKENKKLNFKNWWYEMNIVLLGVIYSMELKVSGFRVIEVNENEGNPIRNIPYKKMLLAYENNKISVRGIGLRLANRGNVLYCTFEGKSFGDLGTIIDNKVTRNRYTILTQYPGGMYKVADTLGRVNIVPKEELRRIGLDLTNVEVNSNLEVTSLERDGIPKDDMYDTYSSDRLNAFQSLLGMSYYNNNDGVASANEHTDNIETLRLDVGISSIAVNGFKGKVNLKEFIASESLISIGDQAFNGCTQLNRIELNEGLRFIGRYAFIDACIEELVIPSTITDIGFMAFGRCSKLKVIKFHRSSRRCVDISKICSKPVKLVLLD